METYYVLALLLFLIVIILFIYLINQNKNLEYFDNSQSMQTQIEQISNIPNLPNDDIHFVIDSTESFIEIPVLNYKLNVYNKNIPYPPNTSSLSNIKYPPNMPPNIPPDMLYPSNMPPPPDIPPSPNMPPNIPPDMLYPSNMLPPPDIPPSPNMPPPFNMLSSPNITPMPSNLDQNNTNMIQNIDNSMEPVYITVFKHKGIGINNSNKYSPLGQYIHISNEPLDSKTAISTVISKKVLSTLTSSNVNPIRYNLIWSSDMNEDGKIFTAWHPVGPTGYVALGDVIVMGVESPPFDYIRCLPISRLEPINISSGMLWQSTNNLGKNCICWGASNLELFRVTNEYYNDMPELKFVFNLPQQYLKQNTILQNATDSSKGVRV